MKFRRKFSQNLNVFCGIDGLYLLKETDIGAAIQKKRRLICFQMFFCYIASVPEISTLNRGELFSVFWGRSAGLS